MRKNTQVLTLDLKKYRWNKKFLFLVGVPLWISSSAVGLKPRLITARLKKYNSIIKKKEKTKSMIKYYCLAWIKLNRIIVLISEASIDSYLRHDEIIPMKYMLKECDWIKEKIKYPNKKEICLI